MFCQWKLHLFATEAICLAELFSFNALFHIILLERNSNISIQAFSARISRNTSFYKATCAYVCRGNVSLLDNNSHLILFICCFYISHERSYLTGLPRWRVRCYPYTITHTQRKLGVRYILWVKHNSSACKN